MGAANKILAILFGGMGVSADRLKQIGHEIVPALRSSMDTQALLPDDTWSLDWPALSANKHRRCQRALGQFSDLRRESEKSAGPTKNATKAAV